MMIIIIITIGVVCCFDYYLCVHYLASALGKELAVQFPNSAKIAGDPTGKTPYLLLIPFYAGDFETLDTLPTNCNLQHCFHLPHFSALLDSVHYCCWNNNTILY